MFHRECGYYKTSYEGDQAILPFPIAKQAIIGFAVLFLLVFPFMASDYYLSQLSLVGIAVVGALGLNILLGYTGQISIGHAAFMSVGAYTAANLVTRIEIFGGPLPFWLAVPAGGCMAALVGLVVGIPSLRVKGLYLAIATLAAQFIIEWTINHTPAISGGIAAAIEVDRPSLFGWKMDEQWELYLFVMFFAILALMATINLIRSRIGRALVAIRDQDIAAEIIGISVFKYKLYAFAISSFFAGVTGVLYMYYFSIATYEQFQIVVSIDFLAMCIIGGLGSIVGTIFGAFFIIMLPVAIRLVMEVIGPWFMDPSYLPQVIGQLRLVFFGGLIMVFLIAEPDGLNRLWQNIRSYFRVWPFSY